MKTNCKVARLTMVTLLLLRTQKMKLSLQVVGKRIFRSWTLGSAEASCLEALDKMHGWRVLAWRCSSCVAAFQEFAAAHPDLLESPWKVAADALRRRDAESLQMAGSGDQPCAGLEQSPGSLALWLRLIAFPVSVGEARSVQELRSLPR